MTMEASRATTPSPLSAMLTCRINSVPLASYLSILSTLHLGVRGYKTKSFLLPLDVAIPNPACKIYSGHRLKSSISYNSTLHHCLCNCLLFAPFWLSAHPLMKIAQVTTNVLGRYGVEGSNLGSCFGMQFTVLVIFVDPHVCVCVLYAILAESLCIVNT